MARPKKAKTPDPGPEILIGKHYAPKELVGILGVTISMLAHMRIKGRGPKFLKVGLRNVIYSAVEVEKYLKERERLSTSDDGTRYTRLAPYGSTLPEPMPYNF